MRNPDLIVTGTNPVVMVFKAATSTIPVVQSLHVCRQQLFARDAAG
jgi:hypothetical protein